jgi:4-aminobutyrate aminotransferase
MLERIKELLQTDEEDDFNDYHRVLLPTTREEIVVTAADGMTVDVLKNGERYSDVIDGTSQVGTNPLGHRYKPIMDELRQLLRDDSDFPLMLAGQDSFHPLQRKLAERFTDIFPGNLSQGDLKTYYCNSGSEAVERGCLKSAQLHRGGNSFVAFEDAFHGRTSLALSHTTSTGDYTEGFNFLARTLVIPYATHSGGAFHHDPEENAQRCLDVLRKKIKTEGPENINSILIEPLQGEGGYNVPHTGFMQGVREIATEHHIPLIADEVQAALRTGEWFGIENFDVEPDMIAVAKAFSGGVSPFGASLIKDRFATEQQSKHSGTFGGNPKDCLMALKTIETITEEDLLQNAKEEGSYLEERFEELERHDNVHETRGRGLFRGIEIRKNGKPAPERRDRILEHLLEEEHIWAEACGNDDYNTAIRFLLPLNIERKHTRQIADGMENALKSVGS